MAVVKVICDALLLLSELTKLAGVPVRNKSKKRVYEAMSYLTGEKESNKEETHEI